MARKRRLRSISVPITLGAITVPLSLALLVGWLILLGQKIARGQDITADVWLLVLGALSFVVIIVVLVLFSIAVARGIIEVRKQDSFIDSVTHELKSPLASLQLCLETLGRGGLDEAQQDNLRSMMLDDVERLRSFIDDVLNANRLLYTRGGLLNLSDVRVAELLESCARAVVARHKISDQAIDVRADRALTVTTDRASLELVVKNLIDNAVKYSDENVNVSVSADVDDKARLVVEVRDEGIGIPGRDLKRVFHRFYRVEDDEVRARKGTGLGLFVVSALVRQMGGKVEANSEGAGRGTTMRVLLPSAMERAA